MPEARARWHESLPAHAASVGRARQLLRTATADHVPGDVVETAELLVSELVSNALIHAGTAIDLEVSVAAPDRVEVSVGDGSPHSPVRREYGAGAPTGRGIRLLDDLSSDWGVQFAGRGKRVWFRLNSASASAQTSPFAPSTQEAAAPPNAVTVEFVNVPLQLYARWQQHAEALLREYLLATFGDADPEAQLRRHAECSDAVALLAEGFSEARASGAEDEPHEHMRLPLAQVTVPKESVPHFSTLDSTLDLAISLADTDQLLTRATDTEMRRFRTWICREVTRQSAGGAPTPWKDLRGERPDPHA